MLKHILFLWGITKSQISASGRNEFCPKPSACTSSACTGSQHHWFRWMHSPGSDAGCLLWSHTAANQWQSQDGTAIFWPFLWCLCFRYYCLAFETHAEAILTLSVDTTSGFKMPKTRSPLWKAFVALTSPCCTHHSHWHEHWCGISAWCTGDAAAEGVQAHSPQVNQPQVDFNYSLLFQNDSFWSWVSTGYWASQTSILYMANCYCVLWVTSQSVGQPAFSDTHLLSAAAQDPPRDPEIQLQKCTVGCRCCSGERKQS